MTVAVATTNQIAADAGRAIVSAGGGAVDAAIAASLVTLITEPGVCALGGGGYVTVGTPDRGVVTIDGNVEMPGRGADPARFGVRDRVVTMAYGGGITTVVGYGSVAVPGALAALAETLRSWGRIPWRVVLEPTIEIARDGFPLSAAARNYLRYSHEEIFGWHPESHAALHDETGRLRDVGELICVPGLVDSLEEIAVGGVDSFYRGDLARAMAADFEQHGGLVTLADLESYRAIVRPAARWLHGSWTVATNPPPAVGGVMLLAMLHGLHPESSVDPIELVECQRWAMEQRRRIERSGDYTKGTVELLQMLARTDPAGAMAPSTVHTSAVDTEGAACAITMSAGYGSGLIPGGTGMWMNNALGEQELNPGGLHAMRPGTRLASNMAPTIVSSPDGQVLAIGSPGADRITSALQQVIDRILAGQSLDEAVQAPRLHVEQADGQWRVAAEPGLDLSRLTYPIRRFESRDMFFGGVAAAMRSPGGVDAAADVRRTGGVFVGD